MAWTLCTSGAAIVKAGANSAYAVISGAGLSELSSEAEGAICSLTRYDWVTNYASVGTNFKPILADLSSDMIASRIISYDMSGYTSRAEAGTMLDVLRDNISRNLDALKQQEIQEVLI